MNEQTCKTNDTSTFHFKFWHRGCQCSCVANEFESFELEISKNVPELNTRNVYIESQVCFNVFKLRTISALKILTIHQGVSTINKERIPKCRVRFLTTRMKVALQQLIIMQPPNTQITRTRTWCRWQWRQRKRHGRPCRGRWPPSKRRQR